MLNLIQPLRSCTLCDLEILPKLALQRLVDQKDHCTARCASHDRDPTSGVQSSDPSRLVNLVGHLEEFGSRSSALLSARVCERVVLAQFGLGLHGRLDAVGREEDDVVAHPRAGAGQDQLPRAQILLAERYPFACQRVRGRPAVLGVVGEESTGDDFIRREPGCRTPRLPEERPYLAQPEASDAVFGDDGSDDHARAFEGWTSASCDGRFQGVG